LPKEIYRDKNGNFTIDPDKVETIIPFGDYKGYILALTVEILAGSLVNMPMGKKEGKFRGALFIVIDPRKFTNYNKFISANSKLTKEIKKLKREKGIKEIMIPGEDFFNNRKKIIEKGYLEVSDNLFNKIKI